MAASATVRLQASDAAKASVPKLLWLSRCCLLSPLRESRLAASRRPLEPTTSAASASFASVRLSKPPLGSPQLRLFKTPVNLAAHRFTPSFDQQSKKLPLPFLTGSRWSAARFPAQSNNLSPRTLVPQPIPPSTRHLRSLFTSLSLARSCGNGFWRGT